MKKYSLTRSIRLSLFGLALLFTLNSFAQSSARSEFDAEIYPGSKNTRFVLVTKNPHEGKIKITLWSSSGKVYQRITRKKNLRTIFDLSQVEDDDYVLNVSGPGHKFSKVLALRTIYAAATKTVEIK